MSRELRAVGYECFCGACASQLAAHSSQLPSNIDYYKNTSTG